MCNFQPKLPKPQITPEKRELPAEPPKPLKIGGDSEEHDKRNRRSGNPFRIDLASSAGGATRISGAQV